MKFNRSNNFICSLFVEQLYLIHDNIHRLDLPLYILLAAGYSGVGIISHCMADHASLQATWRCRRRRVQSSKINYYATCQADKKDINFCH